MRQAIGVFLLLITLLCTSSEAATPRVISLYPGHTDNIAALGAEESIVAVSHNDDLESLLSLPRLAENVTPEAILAHEPDVVIMRSLNERANPNLEPVLTKAGVQVHVIEPPSWEAFDEYLTQLAEILAVDPTPALSHLERVRAKAGKADDRYRENEAGPLVFLEATAKEIHTCSPESWAARVIELCGGVNAARRAKPIRPGSPLAPWGVERAVTLATAGLDIYLVQQGAMNASTREEVEDRPWFVAFKGIHLDFIAERDLSRPSLIGLERGIDRLLLIFYPEMIATPAK